MEFHQVTPEFTARCQNNQNTQRSHNSRKALAGRAINLKVQQVLLSGTWPIIALSANEARSFEGRDAESVARLPSPDGGLNQNTSG